MKRITITFQRSDGLTEMLSVQNRRGPDGLMSYPEEELDQHEHQVEYDTEEGAWVQFVYGTLVAQDMSTIADLRDQGWHVPGIKAPFSDVLILPYEGKE